MLSSPADASPPPNALLPRGGVPSVSFALGLVIVAAVAFYSSAALRKFTSAAESVRLTHEVQAEIRGVGERLIEAEIALRDFAVHGGETIAERMQAQVALAVKGEGKIRQLTADSPRQQSALDRLEPLIRQQAAFGTQVAEERRARGAAGAIAILETGRGLEIKQQVDLLLSGMDQAEQKQLTERQQRANAAASRVRIVLPVGSVIGIVILLFAIVRVRLEAAERRRVEELLRKSEAAFRLASQRQEATLNALPAHLALLDPSGVIVGVNEAWRRFGAANLLRNEDFAVGENYLEVCEQAHGQCSDDAESAAAGIRRVLRGETPEFSLEYPCHSPEEKRWFRLMVTPVTPGQLDGAVVMHVNITERRLMEDELRVSEERFRATFDDAAIGIANVALDGRYTRVNDKLCGILGYSRAELLRLTYLDVSVPEDRPAGIAAAKELMHGETSFYAVEKRYQRKNGSIVWVNVTATLLRLANGAPQSFVSTCEEITTRKEAELRLRRLNRLHLVLSKTGEAVARAPERQELFDTVCRILVSDGHLRMAFIAAVEPDGRNIRKTASAGEALEVLANLPLSTDDGALGQDVVGTALRTGAPDVINDFAHDPRMAPWRDVSLTAGFRATAAFPLRPGGVTVGALVLCASEVNYFEDDEIRLMNAVAADISFALEVQERKETNERAEAALRMQAHTLDQIGQAVIATDTAGVIFFANRAASDLYEWPVPEMIGRNIMEVTVPGTSREQAEEILREMRAGREWSGEFSVRSRSGREFPAFVTDSPLVDPAGKLIGFVGISTDITSRKETEETQRRLTEQLAAERARLLEAQAVAHVGSWETDLATMELSWSPETYRIFEQSEDLHVTFEIFVGLVHPEDQETLKAALAASMENLAPTEFEHRILLPSGHLKYVEERWQVVCDAAGHPLRAVGSCLDITERHLATIALRRADESLRTTLEAMTEAFITVDCDWRMTYLNAEGERLVQQPRADLLGLNIWEVFPALLGTAFETHYRRAMAENESVSFEAYFEPLGIWLEERVFPSRDGLAIYARDITAFHAQREALRASEREFRTLAEAMPQIVWVANSEGENIYLNQNWCDYTGLSQAECAARGWIEAIHPEDRTRTVNTLRSAIRGEAVFAVEIRLRAADGTYRWWLDRATPQRDEHGHVQKWFGTCTDIHELKMAEFEIGRTNRALTMLSSCNEALLHAEDETELLHTICDIAVKIGGYKMAWVGYPQQDEAGSIKAVASSGDAEEHLARLKISWREDVAGSNGPAGRVLRTGEPVFVPDVREDTVFGHLAQKEEFGFRSLSALPLQIEGRTFGLFVLYGAEVSESTPSELRLLQGIGHDLAFGIGIIRARTERSRLQNIVVNIAAAVSAASGSAFFEEMARNMSEALGAKAGFIARLKSEGSHIAQVIAGVVDGRAAPTFHFQLDDAPALGSAEDGAVADDAIEQFRHCPEVAEIGAKGFVGRWLVNSAGNQIGLIFLLFGNSLQEMEFIRSTLGIFAARAASEIERRQAETRMRNQAELLDAAHEAIYVKDLNDGVLYWNKGAERLYGWTREEVVGTEIGERLYADQARVAEARAKLLEHGVWEGEVDKRTKDGRILNVEVSWTLLRDEAGEPYAILAINTDATERKQLEQQFLRAQRMESIGTLAGGIAHDLNNALSPVILSLDLLKRKFPDPKSQEILHVLGTSAQRGAQMVQQVLSFARGVEGERIEVQVRHLLDDVEKIARDTFPKNIRIEMNAPSDLRTVFGDPTQLHQVLINLCVNARDAMPGGGLLQISAENRDLDQHYAGLNPEATAGPHVFLTVKDSGTGIPPGIIEKLFDPFFTTKEIGKGTGLGLSTSLAIVRSHGGFIRVTSEVRQGATFIVALPAGTSAAGGEQARPQPSQLPRGKGETVLVVDDESSVRLITKQTLEAFGYRVILANDGADAVAIFASRQEEIDVILTDMTMPIMDGPAAIRAIQSMNPKTRIIGASGLAAGGNLSQMAELGVKHFLPKPYTAETLLRALQEILHSA